MWLSDGERLRHADPAGGAERDLGAVDAVIGAVDQGHRDIDDREAQRTLHRCIPYACLDRGDPLLGHDSARDLLLELEALAARQGPHLDHGVAELAMAARLLLV